MKKVNQSCTAKKVHCSQIIMEQGTWRYGTMTQMTHFFGAGPDHVWTAKLPSGDFKKLSREKHRKIAEFRCKKSRLHELLYAAFYAGKNQFYVVRDWFCIKYGGKGGLTRCARPFGAARSLCARSVQLAAPVVEPRSVVLIPPVGWLYWLVLI